MGSNKLISTKVVIAFILILTGFASLKLNANQKEEASFPKVENLLILGAGSNMGADYKIGIFERLRPLAQKIYLCEFEDNTLARKLSDENLVDEVLFVKHRKDYKTLYKSIKSTLQKKHIPVDAVVTYRDEWLEVRSLIAHDYDLSHQDVKAVSISRDKQKARETLQKNGLQCLRFEVGRLKNLERICGDVGFPVLYQTQNWNEVRMGQKNGWYK